MLNTDSVSQFRFRMTNMPAAAITEADARRAVEDIGKDPRVHHVSIAEFDDTQRRWLLNVDLVDGINGNLSGVYSIGKIYGDLRDTRAGWQKQIDDKVAADVAMRRRLDNAAAEGLRMLAEAGCSVGQVSEFIDLIWSGRYIDSDGPLARAHGIHEQVCAKFGGVLSSYGPRPFDSRSLAFYAGSARLAQH